MIRFPFGAAGLSRPLLLLSGLLFLAAPARAEWAVAERPAEEGDGTALAAEAFSESGTGRLEVGCTSDDLLYAGVEYVGHMTAADQLRVAYRVDGRGSIQGHWPTAPATGALRVYNTTPVYVDELVRRLRRGATVAVDIELLPRLIFDLAGSEEAFLPVLRRCGDEPPLPAAEDGENGEDREDEAASPNAPGDPTPPTAAP